MIAILVAWNFTRPRFVVGPAEPRIGSSFSQVTDELAGRTPVPEARRPNGGIPPWNANESIFQETRKRVRQSALTALDRPWSEFCHPDTYKKVLAGLYEYFWTRMGHEKTYPARWGEAGHDYITRQWATPGDLRIERLVAELHSRGLLSLDGLTPGVAARIAPLVKGTHVAAYCQT